MLPKIMTFLELKWLPNPASEKIREYEIWELRQGGEWRRKMHVPGDRSEVRFPLEEGGWYEFKMRAYSLHFGWGPFSPVVYVSSRPTAPRLSTPVIVQRDPV